MQIQQIADLEEETILELLSEKARSYTPEWRFDRENPDAGSALAMAYASMTARTLRQFQHFPEKNQICFFNALGADLRPAAPSEGYVQFFLSGGQTQGQQIPADTMLYARQEEKEIPFKVRNDVFVTPAKLQAVYETFDKKDYISCLYEKEENGNETIPALTLFSGQKKNLQEHSLYLAHTGLFGMRSEGVIELSFLLHGERCLSEDVLEALFSGDHAEILYSNGEQGFVPFHDVRILNGRLCLIHRQNMPALEKILLPECDPETEQYYLHIHVRNFEPFSDFSLEDMAVSLKASYIRPDMISYNEEECSQAEYFPFGERMGIYDAVYFASEEALGKKGAFLSLSFRINFVKIPIREEEDSQTEWKWIMKSSELQPDKQYDILITEVIWEYYNGKGWARLFPNKEYADIFHAGDAKYGQLHTLEFFCPKDIEPIAFASCEACMIRARIVKMSNLYKTKGNYFSPVLSDTYFRYDYQENTQKAEMIYIKNNLMMQRFSEKELLQREGIRPFFQTGDGQKTVYFLFDCMPEGGPVRVFLEPEAVQRRQEKELAWEYYSRDGWKELNMADETEQLSKAGLLIFVSPPDFEACTFFQKTAFFIRIRDKKDSYAEPVPNTTFPRLKQMLFNITDVVNLSRPYTEYFRMETYQVNPVFSLQQKKLLEVQVFVDEAEAVLETELEEMQDEERVQCVYDENGILLQVWVRWEAVEDFQQAGPWDRVYRADANEGTVFFGNGVHGRIPSASETENIRIRYRVGGGSDSNVPAGSIANMELVHGYVNNVQNPMPMTGGSDRERTGSALKRLARELRHQNRAVTVYDYECLALQATESISKVKCVTGKTEDGGIRSGAMTMVVCLKDYRHEKERFPEIKERMKRYFSDKISLHMLSEEYFFIIMPVFVSFDVRMSVLVGEYSRVFQMKNEILGVLERFLDPLTGNFDQEGFEIGTLPNHIQIRNAVNRISGLRAIRDMVVTTSVHGQEVDLTGYPLLDFVLPVSGRHEINIQVERNMA